MSQSSHSSQSDLSQHITTRPKRPANSPIKEGIRATKARLEKSKETETQMMDAIAQFPEMSKDHATTLQNILKGYFDEVRQQTLDLIEQLLESNKAMEARVAKLEEHVESTEVRPNDHLTSKVAKLEQKMASMEKRDKKAQISQVANNVIIHTLKSNAETANYVRKLVQDGTNKEITNSDISFYDIKNPMFGKPGNITRAVLPGWMKRGLFKSLPAASKTPVGKCFRISNECPGFLRNKKKLLEKVSFAIRTQNPSAKTKISLKATDLVLSIKDSADSEWFTASDVDAEKYHNISLIYRDGEKAPKEARTVGWALRKTVRRSLWEF